MKNTDMRGRTIPVVALSLLILLVFLVAAATFFSKKQPVVEADTVPDLASVEPPPSSEAPPPPPPPVTVNILGVGDNLIHEGIYNQARKRGGGAAYDFSRAYTEVAEIISAADIALINQETMLADVFAPSSYPLFNSPTELGDELVKIGFDVINHANNHSIDKGEKGILSTLAYWQKHPQIKTVGAYINQEDAAKIRTIEKDGITFSFVGMTQLTNGLSLPQGSPVILGRTTDKENVKSQIAAAKAIADVVVVNVHWGVEYTHKQNSYQSEMAQLMVDAGADIIFGHHPHVIQPVSYLQRPDGSRAIVSYSLGNFISAQDKAPRMLGGMLNVAVTKDFVSGKVSISDASFIPVVTHYGKGFGDIKNYPLEKYSQELASAHGVRGNSPEFSLDYLHKTTEAVIDTQFLN